MGRKIKSFREWLKEVIKLTANIDKEGMVWGMDTELGTLDELVDQAMGMFFSKKNITIEKILVNPNEIIIFKYDARNGFALSSEEHNRILESLSEIINRDKDPSCPNGIRMLLMPEWIQVEGVRDMIKWHKKELEKLEKRIK